MKPVTSLLGLTVCLLSGCVIGPVPRYRVREAATPPLNSEEIVRMVKAGLSEATIIEKINADGLEARPTAEQIAALKKDGVSEGVLRAMLTAPLRERTEERIVYTEDYYPYYYPYSYSPWWYGPYWYSWPYWGWQFRYYPFHGWGYRGYGPVRRYRP